MNDSLVIRPGNPGDLAMIIAMEKVAFKDPWNAEALYSELLTDHMRLPLVAELGGHLCGYLMSWRVVDQLHILNIATDPNYLRQGVGTALLVAAARLATEGGQVEMTLEVRRSNTGARGFYKHHHFAETGLRRGYYQEDGEDAIIMTAACSDILRGNQIRPT